MSDLWNVIHKEEKAMLEHTIRLHTCKTIYLNLSLVPCIFYVLSPCTVYIVVNFILFSLENDDMESSKRCVKLLSLIFIIRCLTKSNFIVNHLKIQIRDYSWLEKELRWPSQKLTNINTWKMHTAFGLAGSLIKQRLNERRWVLSIRWVNCCSEYF